MRGFGQGHSRRVSRLEREVAALLAGVEAAAQPAPDTEPEAITIDPVVEEWWTAFRAWLCPDWRPGLLDRHGCLLDPYDPRGWPPPKDGPLADDLVRLLVLWAGGFHNPGASHPCHRRWTAAGRMLTESYNPVDYPLWWFIRDRSERYPAASKLDADALQRLRALYRTHLECPPELGVQVWEIVQGPGMSATDCLLAVGDLDGGDEALWPFYERHGWGWPGMFPDQARWGDRIVRTPGPEHKVLGYTREEMITYFGGVGGA